MATDLRVTQLSLQASTCRPQNGIPQHRDKFIGEGPEKPSDHLRARHGKVGPVGRVLELFEGAKNYCWKME